MNAELTAFQRTFSREIKRCDEMERKLRYIDSEIAKEGLKTDELDDMPPVPQPKGQCQGSIHSCNKNTNIHTVRRGGSV